MSTLNEEWYNMGVLTGKLQAVDKIISLNEINKIQFEKNWLLINVVGLTQEELDENIEWSKNHKK